jgi:hypothetical protein
MVRYRLGKKDSQAGHRNRPKPTDMTIHWKALEVPLVFRFNHLGMHFQKFYPKSPVRKKLNKSFVCLIRQNSPVFPSIIQDVMS